MEERFINLFKETLEIEELEITPETRFRELEQWDSLAYLSVIALIDEEYDVQIEGNEFKQLNTVGEIIGEIQRRVG